MKKDIEKLFTDRCNVYIYENIKNDGIMLQEKKILYDNIKCRICFKNRTNNQSEEIINSAAKMTKKIMLFIPPEFTIPAGSTVEITRMGETITYTSSGAESVYESHREIALELYEKWS